MKYTDGKPRYLIRDMYLFYAVYSIDRGRVMMSYYDRLFTQRKPEKIIAKAHVNWLLDYAIEPRSMTMSYIDFVRVRAVGHWRGKT